MLEYPHFSFVQGHCVVTVLQLQCGFNHQSNTDHELHSLRCHRAHKRGF